MGGAVGDEYGTGGGVGDGRGSGEWEGQWGKGGYEELLTMNMKYQQSCMSHYNSREVSQYSH